MPSDERIELKSVELSASSLCKEYPQPGKAPLRVIDNLTFDVERGKLLAIVGPSGCGKSTLLRILSGGEQPTTGKVQWTDEKRRDQTASIEQSPSLLPWRTALQNASLGPELRGKFNDVVITRITDAFREFGLGGFENTYPEQLSGGMQQRVAIIRALESKPLVLFCDEPFSAVDFVTRLTLNTDFKKLCRMAQCTTVFVTHNIEEAIFLGDRILVLGKRPTKIVFELFPKLSVAPHNAVRCRQSPEFSVYFEQIWTALNGGTPA
jgi:NitT/TauT family transport system ATP-binding protein